SPALNETKGPWARLLIPDYSVTTQIGNQKCSLLHLEGKVASNKGYSQTWDDLTKLAQELKYSLDTIIKLQPGKPVYTLGVLVKGFYLQFYAMNLQSEGVYIFQKYADCHMYTSAKNLFPLGRLLEILETTKELLSNSAKSLREVKVNPSTTPCVPL
ncbi:hypothetical protein BGZ76_006617, partial [Entomortierella beljakovae]